MAAQGSVSPEQRQIAERIRTIGFAYMDLTACGLPPVYAYDAALRLAGVASKDKAPIQIRKPGNGR